MPGERMDTLRTPGIGRGEPVSIFVNGKRDAARSKARPCSRRCGRRASTRCTRRRARKSRAASFAAWASASIAW